LKHLRSIKHPWLAGERGNFAKAAEIECGKPGQVTVPVIFVFSLRNCQHSFL
jgi:hypothetical protein